MVLDGVSLTESKDRAVKSAQQDQATCMCRLILLYTLCRLNLWMPIAEEGLK